MAAMRMILQSDSSTWTVCLFCSPTEIHCVALMMGTGHPEVEFSHPFLAATSSSPQFSALSCIPTCLLHASMAASDSHALSFPVAFLLLVLQMETMIKGKVSNPAVF